MKNTMKQWIALFLTVLLCLAVVACGKEPAPVDGEVSSLVEQEEVGSAAEQEENSESVADYESVVAELLTADGEDQKSEQEQPTQPMNKSESPSVVSTQPEAVESQASHPVESDPVSPEEPEKETVVNPIVAFSPPPQQEYFTHSEKSLEALVAWINSPEALTEENGAYAAAVNFYREHGSLVLASLPKNLSSDNTYSFHSRGEIYVLFSDNLYNSMTIRPVAEENASAARKGIKEYFTAQGKTVQAGLAEPSQISDKGATEWHVAYQAPLAKKATDSVYEVVRRVVNQGTGREFTAYLRRVVWFYEGFEIAYHFGTVTTQEETLTIEEILTIDAEMASRLTQLTLHDLTLTAAPAVVSTPVATQ